MKATLMGPDDQGCWYLCDGNGHDWPVVRDRKEHAYAARLFGWTACECGQTNGTTACEHRTVEEMLEEARAFLMDHIGDEIEPPRHIAAYFEEMEQPGE